MLRLAVLALLLSPGVAAAQSGMDGRLNDLQRSLATLSTQIRQLETQNQQLQQRLDKMQATMEQRLDRLEKPPAPAKPTPKTRRSKN